MARPRKTREEAIERFFECVKLPAFEDLFKPSVLGPCWLWTAALSNGYGILCYENKRIHAHRFAWTVVVERPIAFGRQLDHLCRVRACVNPDHLQPVSQSLNLHRMEVARADRANSTCRMGHYIPDWTQFAKRGCPFCKQHWQRMRLVRNKERIRELPVVKEQTS